MHSGCGNARFKTCRTAPHSDRWFHLSCIDHETPGTGARPRQKQVPETEGWVFVCAAHPLLSYPLATPTLPLHRIALNKSAQVRKKVVQNPRNIAFHAARAVPCYLCPSAPATPSPARYPVVAHLLPVARIQPQIHEGLLAPQRIVAPECGHHFTHITGKRTRTPVAERPVRSAPTRSTACRDHTYSHSPQTQA